MSSKFSLVRYSDLNSRQKENFNFQKVSAVLADYGFATLRLSDDWQGADFIAQHVDGETFLKIQLKSRLALDKKYSRKELWIAFFSGGDWYLYPHDALLRTMLDKTDIGASQSWKIRGTYSFPRLTRRLRQLIARYKITSRTVPGTERQLR